MELNNNKKVFQSDNAKNEKKSSYDTLNLNKIQSEDSTNTNQTKTYNFTDFDHMIHSGENTVTLNGNVVLEESEAEEYLEGIGIDVNEITIDGNGFTIDAQRMTRIFKITGDNVTIKNVTLKNGFTEEDGGSIYNNGELTLFNVLLQKNTAKLAGGAVYNEKTTTIEECKFEENTAQMAGAVHNEINAKLKVTDSTFEKNTANTGGAIGNNGLLTVKHSTLNNNSGEYGGSISNNSSITIKNSHLSNNKAEDRGGAIYNIFEGIIKISDSITENNTAKNGGAIYSEDSIIDMKKSSFNNNFSEENGAAINNNVNENDTYKKSDNELSNICIDCDFINNHSNKYGTVYTNDNIDFIGCNFKDNTADEEGNTIYFESAIDIPLTIEDSYIETTSAENSDIYIKNPSLLNITDTRIRNNSDNYVIYNHNGTVNISNISFERDKPSILNNYIIWIDDETTASYIKSTENSIIRNKNESSDSSNGFGYMEELINGDSEIITLDCDIHMHESERFRYPDGIELHRNNLVIDGQNHVIDANKLSRIFKISGTNITLKNIQFKNGCYFKSKVHENEEGGGAIYTLPTASVSIRNCTFIENDSNHLAGCINNKGVMNIHNSIFKNNYAQRICASIYNSNILDLNDCVFENNYAPIDSSSRDYYLKSRANIVNKSEMTVNRCNFRNSKYFFMELLKIGMNKFLKIISLTFSISFIGYLISGFLHIMTSFVFPSPIISEYLSRIERLSIVVSVFIVAISIIGIIISLIMDNYMKKQGFIIFL